MKSAFITLLDHILGHVVHLFNNILYTKKYKIPFFMFLYQNPFMFSSYKNMCLLNQPIISMELARCSNI